MHVQSLVRTLETQADPLDLFLALTQGGGQPDTLLLESAEPQARHAERSLLMLRAALRLTCRGRIVEVTALSPNGEALLDWLGREFEAAERLEGRLRIRFSEPAEGSERQRLLAASPLDVLRRVVFGPRRDSLESVGAPMVVGTFSYDLLGCFERLPEPRSEGLGWPDYEFWLPDLMIWMNHRQHAMSLVAQAYGDEAKHYNDATQALTRLALQIQTQGSRGEVPGGGAWGGGASPPAAPDRALEEGALPLHPARRASPPGPPGMDLGENEYEALVERMREHVRVGDVFQIVLSRTFSLACPEPARAYRRLRELNPSPYMFYVNSPSGVLFGASPETALKVDGTPPLVEIHPIAGTRSRGADADQDGRLEAELRLDEKELAEHMMLVDLARNDVARVSLPGSRSVAKLLSVVRYSHVMHLVSKVTGQLKPELDALHAYVATMNMGTLTGAPKLKAAELLRRYETSARGPYGGAVGYFTAEGRMDTSIVIRSAVVRGGVAHVRAGAGIVHDSKPAAEAQETRRKAEAVLRAIREAHP